LETGMTEPLTTEFCLHLARAWATLVRRLDNALGAHHGIGFADYQLLLHLQRAPEGRLGRAELADKLGVTASGVTRSLLPLEKIGLVIRQSDPRDVRAAVALITPAGAELVTNASVVVDNVSRNVLGGFGRARLEAPSTLLAQIAGLEH
jgi:DNA-binding MarR family transcriptional regulator